MENKLKVEYVDIDTIKPYKNNAKLHPKEQIEQIKKSIENFGMNDPIGIWNNEIVEGHGRILACKELGYKQIPVIKLDHLTDEERKSYIIAHNKLTMNSDFDIDILRTELENLKELDFDLELTGFNVDELDDIFQVEEEQEIVEDDFDIEPPEEPKAKLGDIYQLGKWVICKKCGKSTTLTNLMCGDIIILGDNMLCLICNNEFKQKHFNQKYCSENCKHKAKRISQEKYKKTEKGKISNQKWINSDRRKENEKKYRQNPIAKHKAVLRTMKYLENSEYGREQKRLRDLKYSQTDKGKENNRKATKKYRKTEKGKLNNRKQKYLRRSMTPIDTETIKELLNGDYCYYCKNKIKGIKTIDHKVPIIKGGTNDVENLVLSCKHCNSQKGSKTEEEYKEWLKLNAQKQGK